MKREWMGAARLGVVLFLLYLAIHYWGTLSSLLLLGLGAAFPLVLGAVIAYAVNILMSLYEGWYFPDTKSPFVIKSRRPVCLLLAFASLIAIVFLLIRRIAGRQRATKIHIFMHAIKAQRSYDTKS